MCLDALLEAKWGQGRVCSEKIRKAVAEGLGLRGLVHLMQPLEIKAGVKAFEGWGQLFKYGKKVGLFFFPRSCPAASSNLLWCKVKPQIWR